MTGSATAVAATGTRARRAAAALLTASLTASLTAWMAACAGSGEHLSEAGDGGAIVYPTELAVWNTTDRVVTVTVTSEDGVDHELFGAVPAYTYTDRRPIAWDHLRGASVTVVGADADGTVDLERERRNLVEVGEDSVALRIDETWTVDDTGR